jgi:hypothetical protein
VVVEGLVLHGGLHGRMNASGVVVQVSSLQP